MRAFVDHVEAVVAPILFDRKVARVAVAAMHLDRQRIGLQTPFAGPTLGNRREHLQQQACLIGHLCGCGVLLIHQARAVQLQRQRAFAIRFLRQQHALDVGVFDDWHLGLRRVFTASAHGAALGPVAGVVERGVVARQPEHGGCNADTNARLVHHVEHALQALAGCAHQIADGTCALAVQTALAQRELAFAKIEQRIGGAAPTELVVQACQRHVVALAGEFALGVDHALGNDEQRDAARARHQLALRVGDLGQHQVDDVFGQVVLARRNPHLVALEAVAGTKWIGGIVRTIGHGARGHVRQARARLRLGQAHGARPAA